jgi:hypothetical protein
MKIIALVLLALLGAVGIEIIGQLFDAPVWLKTTCIFAWGFWCGLQIARELLDSWHN